MRSGARKLLKKADEAIRKSKLSLKGTGGFLQGLKEPLRGVECERESIHQHLFPERYIEEGEE